MPFYGWIVLPAYLVGYVATWRRAVWIMAYEGMEEYEHEPASGDWWFAALSATVISFFWPLVALGYKLSDKEFLVKKLSKPPKAQQLREKALELDKRERRIEHMERELGIGKDDS